MKPSTISISAAGLLTLLAVMLYGVDSVPPGWRKLSGVVTVAPCALRSQTADVESDGVAYWVDCTAVGNLTLSAMVTDADSNLEGRTYWDGNLGQAVKLRDNWTGDRQPNNSTALLPLGAVVADVGPHKLKFSMWGDGYVVEQVLIDAASVPLRDVYIEVVDPAGAVVAGTRTRADGTWDAWVPTGWIGSVWAIGQIKVAAEPLPLQ